jgi:DMSO/TMAO reductase YedYZ molybdopterin-dependent catalytic subunit
MSNPKDADLISPDVRRDHRIPPRQALTRKWPVLHAGPTPHYADLSQWTFHIFGLVERPWECAYAEFTALPRVKVQADMHCVTRWSKVDNVWEGVSTREVMKKVTGKHDGQDLEPDHGYPLRLVIPRLYAWKSAKWVRGVELLAEDRAGFWERWENGGYHMRGDPWKEERFRDDR